MLSRKGVISAMIGAAMLAMPVSALAGHHDHDGDFHGRPNAWHDQGEHKGWFKHDRDNDHFRGFPQANVGSRYYMPPVRNVPPRAVYWNPPSYQPRPAWYNHERDDDDYRPAPPPAWYHHEPDRDDYPQAGCDEDGDNCNWGGGGYNYGPPISYYDAVPPSAYNTSQQVNFLLQRRQQAYLVLAKMRARHDRNAANRMLGVINNLNARIYALNHQGAYYNPPVNYGNPYSGSLAGNLLGGGYDPYAAGYNNGGYAAGSNPTLGALTGLVGPLLGLPPY